MEVQDRSRSPSRRTSRVEQVVGRWLRRSRDSSSRERILADGRAGESGVSDQRSFPIRVTLQILRDPTLDSHGFSLSMQPPLVVQEVIPGGPADGRLVPGDQVLKINSVMIEDLSTEQAADIIRESEDSVTMTVLRHTLGPKSSFITAEKRAQLKTNPVKVRFAEEVVVNGHSQGNSLLFLPNVLKVYLENGQTKAFKFEPKTNVKDIVLTLKEKLSIHCIEHFTLVLEQQYSTNKLLMLHEEELIQEVVQKKETQDYRCLFRVCFMPRNPLDMVQEDPVAFEYLYLQSVNDVLQERFAVEMKCHCALRLAALNIRERLLSCGHTQKASLRSITKNWGIENFVSPTLQKNMREKDLKKTLSYHLKKIQTMEPRHKVMSVSEARLNYLTELGELKSFGGRSFSATIMLQDRESMVSLLVGAKYGVSQVINHKLSIMTTLAEFSSISRIELLPESDKVSLVKIYLQDIKAITLMLEAQAAKDLSCLVAGYCKLLVDPTQCVFPWTDQPKEHRISAEEGYVSRGCSDSEESSEIESTDPPANPHFSSKNTRMGTSSDQKQENKKDRETEEIRTRETTWQERVEETKAEEEEGEGHTLEDFLSEASDSCRSDSRFIPSCSSDSMDALEEDDLMACSLSLPVDPGDYSTCPLTTFAQEYQNGHLAAHPSTKLANTDSENEPFLHFAELSRMPDCLPSPPEASEEEYGEGDFERAWHWDIFTFEDNDARHFYNICSSVTPDSACSLTRPHGCNPLPEKEEEQEGPLATDPIPILQPPPGFGDSSSEDEFFDAHDRLSSPEFIAPKETTTGLCFSILNDGGIEQHRDEEERKSCGSGSRVRKKSRKRRSFLDSNYTSQVSFPGEGSRCDIALPSHNPCPTVPSLSDTEGEPAQLESKLILNSASSTASSHAACSEQSGKSKQLSSSPMEMEPDTMEFKSVTELLTAASPVIMAVRCRVGPEGKESCKQQGEDKACALGPSEAPFSSHMFLPELSRNSGPGELPSSSSGPICKAVRDMMEDENITSLAGEEHMEKLGLELPADCSIPQMHSRGEVPSADPQGSVVHPSCSVTSLSTNPSRSYTPSLEEEDDKIDDDLEPECYTATQEHLERNSGSFNLAIQRDCKTLQGAKSDEASAQGSNSSGTIKELGATPRESSSFSLQSCTTGLVGRLSTSTLRGKIQNLPFLLARSQDTYRNSECSSFRALGISHSIRHAEENVSETVEVRDVKDCNDNSKEDSDEVSMVVEEVMKVFTEENKIKHNQDVGEAQKTDSFLLQKEPNHQTETQFTTHLKEYTRHTLQSGEQDGSPGQILTDGTEPPIELCGVSEHCRSMQFQLWTHSCSPGKVASESPEPSVLSCQSVADAKQAALDVCGCQTVYTNCFSGDGNGFDEELTVYEFSCRTQGTEGAILINTPPSSSISRDILPSSTKDFNPLLSPLPSPLELSEATLEDMLNQLRNRCYRLPGGFCLLQRDVGELLSLLQGAPPGRGQHHQETCSSHFTENKRLLRAEARKLMSLCQRVIRLGQNSEEALMSLAESFHTLVQLASVCLWFSSCGRCLRRHAEVLDSLQDITRTYGEFSQLAENAVGRRNCHDLVIKLLARQCTVLTASIFSLTQLFGTLADL
ncbi:FERM and PDZ domain-containing protein 1 [Arapaima gigas]